MKKIIIPIILAIILISVLVIVIFATNNQENEAEVPSDVHLSTYDAIVAVSQSKNGVYTLERLNQEEVFSDFSEENLVEIFKAFDVIIEQNEVVQFSKSSLASGWLYANGVEFSRDDGKVTVSTDVNANVLKAAMFAAVYIENFPENTCPLYTEVEHSLYNRILPNDIIVSFDYHDHGYDNVRDYVDAWKYQKKEIGEKTYRFTSGEIDVYVATKEIYNVSVKNLLSMLNPNTTERHEFANSIVTVPQTFNKPD